MTLREFRRAYKKLVLDGWKITSNDSHLRLGRKGSSSFCHDPITAVASTHAGFRLRKPLGKNVAYKAGERIGLTRRNALFIMRCADLDLDDLWLNSGQRARNFRGFLLNPTNQILT
jgi:hypothetical protein